MTNRNKKDTPMRPLSTGNMAITYWVCPTCGYKEAKEDSDGEFHGVHHNYCPNCGQNTQGE